MGVKAHSTIVVFSPGHPGQKLCVAEGQGLVSFPNMVSDALQRSSPHPGFIPFESCILPLGKSAKPRGSSRPGPVFLRVSGTP